MDRSPYRTAWPKPKEPRPRFPWMFALLMLALIEGYYAFAMTTLMISGQPWLQMLWAMGGVGAAWLVAVTIVHLFRVFGPRR